MARPLDVVPHGADYPDRVWGAVGRWVGGIARVVRGHHGFAQRLRVRHRAERARSKFMAGSQQWDRPERLCVATKCDAVVRRLHDSMIGHAADARGRSLGYPSLLS